MSMASASFLAELDMHLRSIMSDVNRMKRNENGMDRPFGGIYVLYCGDFYQLDPPSGISLSAVPVAFIKKARKSPSAL